MDIKILYNDDEFFNLLPIVATSKFVNNGMWVCGFENDLLMHIICFEIKKRYIFRYLQAQYRTITLNDVDNEKEFLDKAIIEIKKLNFDFIVQPTTNTLFKNYPSNSIYSPFGSYIIDLSKNEDELWNNIHAKHKNVIRRAKRENIQIRFGIELFDKVYENIKYTLDKNNIMIENKKKLKNKLINNPDNFIIGASFLDDKLQTSLIVPYNHIKGFYSLGGSVDRPMLGSHNLLQWEVIKYLKLKNVLEYDFVGARLEPKDEKLKGIQRFKARFGTVLQKGYLWKYPLKRWKYELFYLLYKLKTKKGDIIEQEQDAPYL